MAKAPRVGNRVAFGVGNFAGSYRSGYQAARAHYGFGNLMRDARQGLVGQQLEAAAGKPAVEGAAAKPALEAGPSAIPGSAGEAVKQQEADRSRAAAAAHTTAVANTQPAPEVVAATTRTGAFRSSVSDRGQHSDVYGWDAGNGSAKAGVANRAHSPFRKTEMPAPFAQPSGAALDGQQSGPAAQPLPLSAATNSTAGQYSTWRNPSGPTPISAQTIGSTFNPIQAAFERRD